MIWDHPAFHHFSNLINPHLKLSALLLQSHLLVLLCSSSAYLTSVFFSVYCRVLSFVMVELFIHSISLSIMTVPFLHFIHNHLFFSYHLFYMLIMAISVKSKIGKPCSNFGLACCFHFPTNACGKGMDLLILSLIMS